MNRRDAPGVDKETTGAFAERFDERIQELYEQMKAGCYKAPPVRRVEIPKEGGKTRKLGIPAVSDRLLQASVARILSAVYEPLFLECSWGYRPGRSAHGAISALRKRLIGGKVMQVFEADIRTYFDRVNHEWLRKMLRLRIADPVILRLIDRWLRAGVMEKALRSQRKTACRREARYPAFCQTSICITHWIYGSKDG
jgi:group II intron reverse transcriptase/maturase